MNRKHLVLALLLVLPGISSALDTVAPVLYDVTVLPESITVGSSVCVRVTAYDELSGVSTSSYYLSQARLRPENGGSQFVDAYNFVLLNGTSVYEAWTQPFSENCSSGVWKAEYVLLYDNAGNYEYYNYGTDYVSTFTVINPYADGQPPVLLGVSVVQDSIVPGSSITLRVSAYDDVSGVSTSSYYLSQARLQPMGSGSQFRDVYNFTLLPGTSIYEAWSQEFNQYSPDGWWKVSYVLLYDNTGNSKYYTYGVDYVSSFTVVNPVSDNNPPVLVNVSVLQEPVIAGSSLTVRFTAYDDVSGISTASYYLTQARLRPMGGTSLFQDVYNFELIPGTSFYEAGAQSLSIWSPEEVWKIEYVLLYDNAGNYKYYTYGADYVSSFTVVNPYKDILVPKSKGEVKIVVDEDAGTRGAINPDKGKPIPVVFKGEQSGTYTLRVFNLLGEQVGETITKETTSAEDWFEWIPGNIASGIYIIHVNGPGVNISKKVPVLR